MTNGKEIEDRDPLNHREWEWGNPDDGKIGSESQSCSQETGCPWMNTGTLRRAGRDIDQGDQRGNRDRSGYHQKDVRRFLQIPGA